MSKINFQALLDIVKASEIQYTDRFIMESLLNSQYDDNDHVCETAGCLLGNYALMAHGLDAISNREFLWAEELGITEDEHSWLFDQGVYVRGSTQRDSFMRFERDLYKVTKEQALSRLRKFIYWKLHKQEMIYDDQGCVREEARQKEGNHNFAQRALEAATA